MHKTVAYMKEYINTYVRTLTLQQAGRDIIEEHFNIPFVCLDEEQYCINGAYMDKDDTAKYVQEFFEGLDTTSVLALYNKIQT